MAYLYITEFAQQGTEQLGRLVPAPLCPPVTEQTRIAVGGTQTQSAVFDNRTYLIMVETDCVCSLLFGYQADNGGAGPKATTDHHRLAANETRFYAVKPSSGTMLSVIANT